MPFQPLVPPPRRWEFVYALADIVRGLAAERSARDVARGAYTAEPRPVTLDNDVPAPAPPPPPPRDQGGLAEAPAGYRGRLTREPRLPAVFPRARRARIAWHLLTLRLPWAWYRRRFTVWQFYRLHHLLDGDGWRRRHVTLRLVWAWVWRTR